MAATIVIALTIFVAGIIAGVILMVRAGIQREDQRDFLLAPQAPDVVSRATRRLTGLYVRDAGDAGVPERESTLV